MANEPATVTFQVRPGGSHRVEKHPETGKETLVLVEPDTSDNENPGGNVEEPASAAAKTGKGRR
ncbi:MAG: hypothetical protein C4529_13945 [Deltaproteobacteria bacterium]|nr:MAG: hypothetical protein C4529_13945 [Deltaproteobacteria bacterium]